MNAAKDLALYAIFNAMSLITLALLEVFISLLSAVLKDVQIIQAQTRIKCSMCYPLSFMLELDKRS